MKNLKTLAVLALALVMVFSFAACGDNTGDGNPTPTNVRATPKPSIVEITAEQMNNYYVAYDVTKNVVEQDPETNEYKDVPKTVKNVEVGFSGVVLTSNDAGETFAVGSSQAFLITSTADARSVFSAHMRYEKEDLEKKETVTIAGRETTHYYYENGLMKIHMYVDESFGSTGICLKYVDEAFDIQTIEVTALEFDVINSKEGYDFATFQQKVPTETPAPEAAA